MQNDLYLSAQDAADQLEISLQTLYAYVSRGLIRSEASGDGKRERRYRAEDVHKLRERKEHRRNPDKLAESALHWGTPILESAITLIADGRFYYRGHDALELAVTHTVEQVAALIWTGGTNNAENLFDANSPVGARRDAPYTDELTLVERFAVMLPIAGSSDLAAYDLRPAAVAQTGARILRLMVTIAGGDQTYPLAEALQRGWRPDDPRAVPLINAALILCADHELNVSSFTARCVASAGSTPYMAVSAGLAALQGSKHGGFTERAADFLQSQTLRSPREVRSTLASYLKRGERIPGFGQVLYPAGDPRAALLLPMIAEAYPDSPAVAVSGAVVDEMQTLIGEHPTLDFALATLSQVCELPAGAGLALFAIGRAIGWIGHAIEQYGIDRLIRPRARYVGKQPNP